MRILHLASFVQGGAGRAIVDLAVAQRRLGHSVTVLSSKTGVPGYGNYEGYLDELMAGDVRVQLVDSMFLRDQRATLAAVTLLSALFPPASEPDIIHAHAATPSAVALFFSGARRTGTPIVQTMHGWGVMKTADQAAADVALMNLVDRVVVPSRHSAAAIASRGVAPDRIEIVPYGVTPIGEPLDRRGLDVYHAMLRARADGLLVIACVGTIGPRKNQTLLVEAIRRASPRLPIFCVFIGDGETAALETAIADAGLQDRALVHGYSRAARRLAAGADVLVLPSRSEGQPLAVLEAFCDGPLALVSDIPELAELVEHGVTGFQFRAGDAASLADRLTAIAQLAPQTRRAIQERAHLLYTERFNAPAMVAGYLRVYERSRTASVRAPGIVPAA